MKKDKEIPNYKIGFDELNSGEMGIYGISLVDSPAIEVDFIKMSKEKVQLETVDKEKKIVTGAVLIPGKKIIRENEKRGLHYIHFEEDVIEKLSYDFFKNDSDKNSWFNHDYSEQIKGNTVVESWIINDEEKDKAVSLGFDLPKGTWMMTTKLSDENWEKYVKTGRVKGYSIDAILDHELIKNKKEDKMTKLFKQFVKFMDEKKEEDVKMLEIKHGDKTLFVDAVEEGKLVTYKDGEESKPLVEETFDFEDKEVTTNEKGEIISVIAKEAKAEDEAEEEVSLEEQEKFIKEMIDKDEELKKFLYNIFKESTEEKVEEVAELAEKDEDVKEKLSKLFSKEMGELAKLKEENVNLKKELEKEPNEPKLKMKKEKVNRGKESTLEAISRINASLK